MDSLDRDKAVPASIDLACEKDQSTNYEDVEETRSLTKEGRLEYVRKVAAHWRGGHATSRLTAALDLNTGNYRVSIVDNAFNVYFESIDGRADLNRTTTLEAQAELQPTLCSDATIVDAPEVSLHLGAVPKVKDAHQRSADVAGSRAFTQFDSTGNWPGTVLLAAFRSAVTRVEPAHPP